MNLLLLWRQTLIIYLLNTFWTKKCNPCQIRVLPSISNILGFIWWFFSSLEEFVYKGHLAACKVYEKDHFNHVVLSSLNPALIRFLIMRFYCIRAWCFLCEFWLSGSIFSSTPLEFLSVFAAKGFLPISSWCGIYSWKNFVSHFEQFTNFSCWCLSIWRSLQKSMSWWRSHLPFSECGCVFYLVRKNFLTYAPTQVFRFIFAPIKFT